ncbi:class I SAM-dependent methyltransferase [Streptomyces sp. KCTC 0041BP]|uniref:class I SAM-dependent methyltransferase n=1 Tax=Streptomyces sp. KCTC 0041BP TaxID=201500 RepID=UPI001AE6C402|nr:class I SAM-dependent methyltransferase [Streptomyces sp. KCTC 0041BP]MBP0932484.1 class I SAM-dependent methyltransferase [Streptomyces sp. KCTC 0041BP]
MKPPPDGLFASTVPYYARFRPAYDPRLFALLCQRFSLDGSQRVLDLGAGSGALTLPLAPLLREVIAVDPEPEMIAEGRRLAAQARVSGIDWRLGSSDTLLAMDVGPVLLTVMGASFHWTDRERLLRDLDTLIEPEGAVVLATCGAQHDDLEPPPWLAVVEQVRRRHLDPERLRGSGPAGYPDVRHQEVLLRSPFSRVEEVHWDQAVSRSVDEVVVLQLSYSFTSPAALGPGRAAFERDLRQALNAFGPDGGLFDEHVRTEAVIATRPPG